MSACSGQWRLCSTHGTLNFITMFDHLTNRILRDRYNYECIDYTETEPVSWFQSLNLQWMVPRGSRADVGVVTQLTKYGNQIFPCEPVKQTHLKEPSDSGRQSCFRSISPVCVIPLELFVSIIGRASTVLSLICSMHMQRRRLYPLIRRMQPPFVKSALLNR